MASGSGAQAPVALSPQQLARRHALLAAARDLAAAGGLEAVTMSRVGRKAGVSRATMYLYFANRDHLLAELAVDQTLRLTRLRGVRPDEAAEPRAALRALVRRMLSVAIEEPRLFSALMATTGSPLPAAQEARLRLRDLTVTMIRDTLVPIGSPDVHHRAEILEHVLTSCLVRISAGLLRADQAIEDLDAAIDLVCPAAIDAASDPGRA